MVKTAVKSGMSIFREALIETATRGEGPVVAPEIRDMWAAAKAMKDDVRALVLAEVGTHHLSPAILNPWSVKQLAFYYEANEYLLRTSTQCPPHPRHAFCTLIY